MYRSGGFFKYEPNPFFSITSDLQRTQNKAKDIQYKMTQHKNDLLYKDGNKVIDDNTLVSITILIAESRTEEHEIMVKLIMNMLNR